MRQSTVSEGSPEAILPFPSVLYVRISVARSPGRRHDYYVQVQREGANDDGLFAKAVAEFRRHWGPVERIVSIDLFPNS